MYFLNLAAIVTDWHQVRVFSVVNDLDHPSIAAKRQLHPVCRRKKLPNHLETSVMN